MLWRRSWNIFIKGAPCNKCSICLNPLFARTQEPLFRVFKKSNYQPYTYYYQLLFLHTLVYCIFKYFLFFCLIKLIWQTLGFAGALVWRKGWWWEIWTTWRWHNFKEMHEGERSWNRHSYFLDIVALWKLLLLKLSS